MKKSSFAHGFVFLVVCTHLAGPALRLRAESITLTPSADTSIFEKLPDNNVGGAQSLAAGVTATPDPARALLKFDLAAALPPGSRITSVNLQLSVVRAPGLVVAADFDLHRLLEDWGEGDKGSGFVTGAGAPASEGEATWASRRHLQQAWRVGGGEAGSDYAVAPSASAGITAAEPLIFASTAELVADAQRMLDNPAGNFGWLLRQQVEGNETTARRFGSREHPTDPPRLTVHFEAPLRILSSGLKDGNFCLKFMAQARGYIVQARGAVDSGEWRNVWVLPAGDVPREMEICDPAPVTGTQFYRVIEM